jgi:hypothetical protein
MANTLTDLIPDLYESLDTVSRELVGMIPAVSSTMTAQRAAVGEVVRSPVAPAATAANITAAQTAPNTGDQTIGNKTITITKSRGVPIRWNGEEIKGVDNGIGARNILRDQFAQAYRTLTNEMETDLAALYAGASRAHGAAGTTPFATQGNLTDASGVAKILKDNGAPMGDASLVLNTTHGANLFGFQARADIQGETDFLKQGILRSNFAGMNVRESGALGSDHTKGAMASATTTASAQTVGQTVIPLATAGTGVVAAGDIITLAGDTNQYVVTSVSFAGANPASGDTITIGENGLRVAQTSSAKAITVVATYDYSMAFSRDAIALASRVPARPAAGDMASDVQLVTDPVSGLTFEIALYKEYRQVHYEVSAAWGVAMIKPEHCALLIG